MSSGASVSALQRLVEQLKLEAGVERIKGRSSLRKPCVHMVMDDCSQIPRKQLSRAKSFSLS